MLVSELNVGEQQVRISRQISESECRSLSLLARVRSGKSLIGKVYNDLNREIRQRSNLELRGAGNQNIIGNRINSQNSGKKFRQKILFPITDHKFPVAKSIGFTAEWQGQAA